MRADEADGVPSGAPLIYASLGTGRETGAGQLTVGQVVALYRARDLRPGIALFGVLGLPARHSVGPEVHNRAFAAHGFDGVYFALETARPGEVVAMLRPLGLRGVSVTAPHKEWAVALADVKSAEPLSIGAANTVVWDRDGVSTCHNTDAPGIGRALRRAGVPNDGGLAVVLGNGGAGRSAALALVKMGYSVTCMGRSSSDAILAWAKANGWVHFHLDPERLAEQKPRVVVTPRRSARPARRRASACCPSGRPSPAPSCST